VVFDVRGDEPSAGEGTDDAAPRTLDDIDRLVAGRVDDARPRSSTRAQTRSTHRS
jgi:hypothetical protein